MTDILQASAAEVQNSQRPFWKRYKALTIILIAVSVLLVVGVTIMAVSQKQEDTACKQLSQTGVTTTATVNSIDIYKPGVRGQSAPTTDIAQADHFDIHVTYTTNSGSTYSSTIHVDYPNRNDLTSLYEKAAAGSLSVEYLPSTPNTVRPASEFASGVSAALCRSS